MKQLTKYPGLTPEEAKTVEGYTESNEQIRKFLARDNLNLDTDDNLEKLIISICHHWKNHAMRFAESKSDDYKGGDWVFNEHGMLSLIHSGEQHMLKYYGSHQAYDLTVDEFAYAVSLTTANHLSWGAHEQKIEWLRDFFIYMYHYSHVLLDKTNQDPSFNSSRLLDAVD